MSRVCCKLLQENPDTRRLVCIFVEHLSEKQALLNLNTEYISVLHAQPLQRAQAPEFIVGQTTEEFEGGLKTPRRKGL